MTTLSFIKKKKKTDETINVNLLFNLIERTDYKSRTNRITINPFTEMTFLFKSLFKRLSLHRRREHLSILAIDYTTLNLCLKKTIYFLTFVPVY